jgi:hypothetical protein
MHAQFQQENLRGRDKLVDLDMGGILTIEMGI